MLNKIPTLVAILNIRPTLVVMLNFSEMSLTNLGW
jgi:hypothetical protein